MEVTDMPDETGVIPEAVIETAKKEGTEKETKPVIETEKGEAEKEIPVEPKEVKTEEDPAKESKVDESVKKVDELQAEIAKLQAELLVAKESKADTSTEQLSLATAQLTAKDSLVTEYEGILNGMLEARLADVPEAIQGLMPANATLADKIDWINKAEKTGIFKHTNPDIEIGKPLNPKDVKQTTDTSKLSASAIMALGYGASKGKAGKK